MATQTTHYRLTKPSKTDLIEIEVLNDDFDKIDTALYAKQDKLNQGTVTLSTNWTGNGPYTQVIEIPGTTQYSKYDLQPGAAVMEEMINDGVIAIWIENNNGVLTAYALGAPPSSALTVQYIRSEVMA